MCTFRILLGRLGCPGAWQAFQHACMRLDRTLLTWRGLHLSFAKMYILNNGPGTGGTSGAAYLREHLFRGVFENAEPDWDVNEATFPTEPAPACGQVW